MERLTAMIKKTEKFVLYTLLTLLCFGLNASAQTSYSLTYNDASPEKVAVSIQLPKPVRGPITFIMPRSIPGAYSVIQYDNFVVKPVVVDAKREKFPMVRDSSGAPRWSYNAVSGSAVAVEYEVDLRKMEDRLEAGDSSIERARFVGILNYSVFGWVDGTEREPVDCTINAPDGWPVFSTNKPSAVPSKGTLKFTSSDYYTVADGQIFMGPRFRVKAFDGPVPLFVVSYCETEDEYLEDYGKQGVASMNILKEYFGELPWRQYSILLRKAVPREASSAPSLAMEHLQSSTFFGGTEGVRKSAMSQEDLIRTIPTYLHHMAHSFIPLRSYGDAYRPFVQEIPPIINNIWFNEGFMWFLPYDALKLEPMKTRFIDNSVKADPTIKRMSLEELSQEASTLYGIDFRLGMGIFSRGAMMAIEMDAYLKEKSNGKSSMKDVLRYIYKWSKTNRRPFTMSEFPRLIDGATGIKISQIYEKWRLPLN